MFHRSRAVETAGPARDVSASLRPTLGALALFAAAVGCVGAAPAVDASAPVSAHTSAVSLRIDVAAGQPATLSVMAFRAAFSGVPAGHVLGMVDPLAADAPPRDCELRDVGKDSEALVARGDGIELEELAGLGILAAGNNAPEIRPSPRLYPDIAATIGGVVAEAGPLRLSTVPEQVRVRGGATIPVAAGPGADVASDSVWLGVPVTGWVRLLNGTAPRDGIVIGGGSDLNLSLTAGDATDTSIELRPYGTAVALVCAVPATGPATPVGGPASGQIPFIVPRQGLTALLAASGGTAGASVAVALDLVRRSSKTLPLSAARVSLEVRTSTFVELRP